MQSHPKWLPSGTKVGKVFSSVLYKTISAAVYGVDANLIEVVIVPIKEQDPRYPAVSLPNAAGCENRERVRSALKKSGCARANKMRNLILPEINAREAGVVDGVSVYPVRSLMNVVHTLNTGNGVQALKVDPHARLIRPVHR